MKVDSMLLAVSLAGTVMGVLSLFGLYGPPVEFTLWAIWGLGVWVPVALWRQAPRPLLALLLVGILAGVQTGIIQAVFAHVLVENNPEVYGTKDDPLTRVFFLVTSTIAGAAEGLVTGLVAWGIARWRARRASPMSARPT